MLKSTYAGGLTFNPAPIVVNEITLVGSRCGRFEEAMKFIEEYKPGIGKMISKRFHLRDAVEAFTYSARPDSLKIILCN